MSAHHSKTKPRVLFLYMGMRRQDIIASVEAGSAPDSPFRGYLAFRKTEDIQAEFFDLGDLPCWVPSWARRHVPTAFLHLTHLPRVRRYDVVIASDSLLLAWTARILPKRGGRNKWIYIAINSSVLMRRHKDHWFRLWALTRMWRSFARIAYIAAEQKEDFLRIGLDTDKLIFLPFGIDKRFFALPGPCPERGYVLSVGRDLGRDFPTLLDAARMLPYRFIVATSPKNIPKDSVVPSNMEIRYDIGVESIRELYRGATCVAILLQDEEATDGSDCTGQTVLLEALSANCTVVATDRAWIREYFTPGVEYLAVPPSDPAAAASAITRLWDDQTLRTSLADAGQKTMQERYSSEAFSQGLLAIVHELV